MVKRPFLIGVAGGISSGKSTVCKKIIEQLAQLNIEHNKQILVISFDSFYRRLSQDDQGKIQRNGIIEHNFDHPSSFDDEVAYQTLMNMMNGREVTIPLYENKTYSFKNEIIRIKPDNVPDVLIVEGILVFYYPKIRDLFNMKLFVDCDADTRLSRRVLRDMREYNRELEHILVYYTKYVKPAFEEFCLPTKKYADVIIPRGAENSVAINLIVQHINDILNNLTLTYVPSYNGNGYLRVDVDRDDEDDDDDDEQDLEGYLKEKQDTINNRNNNVSISSSSSQSSSGTSPTTNTNNQTQQQQQQQQQSQSLLNNNSTGGDLPTNNSNKRHQESSQQTRPH